MSLTKKLRFQILRRDKYTCQYCGRKAPDVALEVDHVFPRKVGGTDDPGNLVAACRDCNAGKSDMLADPHSLDAFVEWMGSEAGQRVVEEVLSGGMGDDRRFLATEGESPGDKERRERFEEIDGANRN